MDPDAQRMQRQQPQPARRSATRSSSRGHFSPTRILLVLMPSVLTLSTIAPAMGFADIFECSSVPRIRPAATDRTSSTRIPPAARRPSYTTGTCSTGFISTCSTWSSNIIRPSLRVFRQPTASLNMVGGSSAPQSTVYLQDNVEEIEDNGEELCYIDDAQGEMCIVSNSEGSFPSATRILTNSNIEAALRYIPILSPILAFLTYEMTAQVFDLIIEALSDRNWVAVDGGQYQTQIITPAVNGIVVPAIALLFATLISNTINTLRQRQLDIRTTLNTEAGEMRTLQSVVDCFPQDIVDQMHLREYLIQYASRLIAESQPGVNIAQLEFTGSTDSEMNGFMAKLNKISVMSLGAKDGSDACAIPPSLLSECYGAVTRLYAERSSRISALQSTFPVLHYAILAILAASICISFLIESDQALLIFLNAVQLRVLWSMLIGTFSALAVVSYDLEDPFRGSYQISGSVTQFYTIRDALRASAQLDAKQKEAQQADEAAKGDEYDSDLAFL